MPSGFHGRLKFAFGQDVMRRAGRADDEIRAVQGVRQLLERNDLAVELFGQFPGAFDGTIGNQDGFCAPFAEVPQRRFTHFSRADDQDGLPGEIFAENLFGPSTPPRRPTLNCGQCRLAARLFGDGQGF